MNRLKARKLNRLKAYDYSTENCYFITSCVKDKRPVFGAVSNGELVLNVYGRIAKNQ